MKTNITATLALGVAGVFAMTGTAHAQGGYAYTCDTVLHVDGGTMGYGDCVPESGTPAIGMVSVPFMIVARDNGVRYPCGPALSAGRTLARSPVAVAPASTAGLTCVPQLPRYLPTVP